MKNVGIIAFILSLAAGTGCVSEQEKQARRACALDVSGDYSEVRPDGVAAGSLTAENESDKTDVKLAFTRGALYDGEQAFIDRLANDDDKSAVAAALDFGVGNDPVARDLVGGQNISDDFGASSKVSVSAPGMAALPSVEGATDAKVEYALDVAIENGSDQLTGNLRVTFEENRPNATSGDKELHTESKDFAVVFQRAAGVLQQDQSQECKDIVDGQ